MQRRKGGGPALIKLELTVDGTQTRGITRCACYNLHPIQFKPEGTGNRDSIIVWYLDGSETLFVYPTESMIRQPVKYLYDIPFQFICRRLIRFPSATWNQTHESKAVTFIAGEEITKGTGAVNSAPTQCLPAASLLFFDAGGIEPDDNPADNFADAETPIIPDICSGKRLGITVQGNNLYAPGNNITCRKLHCSIMREVIKPLPKGNSKTCLPR